MSRFVHQRDMSAEEIVKCIVQARAVIGLCERVAWSDFQNGSDKVDQQLAEDMQFALQLAGDLLGPVQDAIESHEGRALS